MTKTHKPKEPTPPVTLEDVEGVGSRDSRTDSWRVREEAAAEAEDESDELIGTIVADRYRVKALLGRGGMGAVYQAEHLQLKKLVALKILHGYMSSNEEVVARFEREAVAAGRLAHPGIVTATDFGSLGDGSFYLALEYLDGASLADVLAHEGKMKPERAISIAYQIADALCAAHAAGIVHRDMKPDNVLLMRTEGGGDFVKVVDFGIAKMRLDGDHKEGLTRAGLVFGTPEYMAPEQAMGHEADERSDLYAVGVLLYEMLAGTSPFRDEDVTAMLSAQIKDPPPPLPDDVPESLRDAILCLLRKDPADRPEHAAILVEELAAISDELNFQLPPPRTGGGVRLDIARGSRGQSRPGFGGAVKRLSMRPVPVGNKSIPLWFPLAALAVGVAVGGVAMLMNQEAVPTSQMKQQAERVDAEAQLIAETLGGDRDAIAELRKLAIAEQQKLEKTGLVPAPTQAGAQALDAGQNAKTEEDSEAVSKQANRYLVLGRGYTAIKHHIAAIEMYRQAVLFDPHLSQDPELLLDVRTAIAARDAVDDGLDFALRELGSHGADIIFDVYQDHIGQAGMTPVVARAMKLARGKEIMENATPALQVALRLQRAKYCGEYRDIIPDAVKYADDRSLLKLRALRATRGCGSSGKKDCFVCLRKDDIDLAGAISGAEERHSPSYLSPEDETGAARRD